MCDLFMGCGGSKREVLLLGIVQFLSRKQKSVSGPTILGLLVWP